MADDRDSPDPRYGAWKFIHEIKLEDMLTHPIWLWCMELGLPDEGDGPMGGDETSMRPLLHSDEVPLQQVAPPLILLRVDGTDHYASGLYDAEKKILESISVFMRNSPRSPAHVPELPERVTYVAIPSIGEKRGVRFLSSRKDSDSAAQAT
jgi:hypothetical protein